GGLLGGGDAGVAAGRDGGGAAEELRAGAAPADLPAAHHLRGVVEERAAAAAEPVPEGPGARPHGVEAAVEVGDIEGAIGAEVDVVEARGVREQRHPG